MHVVKRTPGSSKATDDQLSEKRGAAQRDRSSFLPPNVVVVEDKDGLRMRPVIYTVL